MNLFRNFIDKLYLDEGIQIKIEKPIIELKHRDYQGKRVFVEITDIHGNILESKIDVGIHKDLDITNEEVLKRNIEFVKSLK